MPSPRFDSRLWNPYAVDDFEASHPALHAALKDWFAALSAFDASALAKLVNAKSPEALEAAREKGEAALAGCAAMVARLDPVIRELKAAVDTADDEARKRLAGLLEAANINRAAFLGANDAVAEARQDAGGYDAVKAKALQALESAAARLDGMAARAADAAAPYVQLHTLVDELKSLWTGVDDALRPLARGEHKALRATFDGRMRAAASNLCIRLHAALSRDRASGAWPMPAIAEQAEGEMAGTIATVFAGALARGEFGAAHATLAPWLQSAWTPESLRNAIAADVATTQSFYQGMTAAPAPGGYYVGSNPTRYDDLVGDSAKALPAEVNAENFIAWCPVEISTSELDGYLTNWDTYCSLFVVVVRTEAGEKIGYVRIGE